MISISDFSQKVLFQYVRTEGTRYEKERYTTAVYTYN